MSFKEMKEQVDKTVSQYGGYQEPPAIVIQMAEEVGEVGRIVNRAYGPKPPKKGEDVKDLGDELADLIYAVICMANREDIDLDEAWNAKFAEREERDKNRF